MRRIDNLFVLPAVLVLQIAVGLGLVLVVQQQFAVSRPGRTLFIVSIVLPPVVSFSVLIRKFMSRGLVSGALKG